MVTYQQETWNDFKKDAMPLLQDNNLERNLFNEPLDIEEETYSELDENGWLKIYTMREGEELLGYCVFFIFTHTHHRTSLHAKQDTIYISPKKRGRALPFVSFCDAELKKEGVKFIHQSVPAAHDWSKVLTRLGYQKLETIYLRSL